MSALQLPPNPSIQQLKKQAKDLRKACQSGDAGALARVRAGLPRLGQASDADLLTAAVVLQEAQHVMAVEQGFKSWNWLQAVVEGDFDALARLTDRETQTLMHDADQQDVAVSLAGASEAAKDRFLGSMSARVRSNVTEEMPFLRTTPAQVEEAQRRVLMEAAELAGRGQIDWPGGRGGTAAEGGSAPAAGSPTRLLELAAKRLEELSPEAVVEWMAEAAEVGRGQGILALDPIADQTADPFVQEALRLAVDGVEADLLADLLRTRSERALLVQQDRRGKMVIEAMMAIQSGDNPRVIGQKMSALYEAAAAPDHGIRAGLTSEELQERLHRTLGGTPYDGMDLGEMAEMLTDMGQLTRREGVGALGPLVEPAGGSLLGDALRMVVDGVHPDAVMHALEEQLAGELQESRTRQRMVVAGMAALQRGWTPAQVAAEVRAVAAQGQGQG